MKDATGAIRIQPSQTEKREHSGPIFMTSSFQYSSAEEAEGYFNATLKGDIYSRFSNPNTTELIDKVCFLEKAEAGMATASGMAAVFATLAAHLDQGDLVVASSSLFGNSLAVLNEILPKWGIKTQLIDIQDTEGWNKAIGLKPKMVLVETPSNPGLDLIDLEWLSTLCSKHNAILAVDNCFATPVIQKPTLFGADLIIHSATKFMDGQGRVLGGMVVGKEDLIHPIYMFVRRTGGSLSPFNAWILSKSLETLEVRMEKHCANALKLAEYFENHTKVSKTVYPFLKSHPQHDLALKQMRWGGGIVCCNLVGDQKSTFKFINSLKILTITANLGDTRTIVTHPATTTHSKVSPDQRSKIGITDTTLRFSVGLENIDDIIEDITQALDNI